MTLALALLLIITLLNLRGLRETGTLMAVPVYLFVVSYLIMLAYGAVRLLVDGPGSLAAVAPPAAAPLTALLVLRTFSAGCTALTGIEAISNGVPAFQEPQARNAQRTLVVMALLMGAPLCGQHRPDPVAGRGRRARRDDPLRPGPAACSATGQPTC